MKLGAIGALALLVLVALSACGGNPPQIVDYSPARGAVDVSTAAPIRITFDHDVDQQSIESRLHLQPATSGNLVWLNPRQLAYQHPTLAPSSTYDVVLEAGYRDLAGNTAVLRHHWSFVTEGPPAFSGSAPANGESGVDPAAYLTVDFSRDMNGPSLQRAITISPPVPFGVRLNPTDGRRAIIAPGTLLEPSTAYTITVTSTALDADGNRLSADKSFAFTTGPIRPLHNWVAFATANADGTSGALWLVNESGFPRKLYDGSSVRSFSWSPEGDTLLLESDGGFAFVAVAGQLDVRYGSRERAACAESSWEGFNDTDPASGRGWAAGWARSSGGAASTWCTCTPPTTRRCRPGRSTTRPTTRSRSPPSTAYFRRRWVWISRPS